MNFTNVGLDVATNAMQIAPNYVKFNDEALYRAWVDTQVKSAVKNISELKLPFSGAYLMVAPDMSARYDVNILEINKEREIEVLCRNAEKLNIEKFVGVKYPKMHTNEFLKIRLVTIEEYIARIEKDTTLTKAEKDFLVVDVEHMSEGVMYIPAEESIKKLAAGLDFDSDAVQCFYDPFIVNTMWELDMIVVDIDDSDRVKSINNIEVARSDKMGLEVFLHYCHNNNKSVGEVTLMNSIFLEILFLLRHGSTEEKKDALKMFDNIFGGAKRSNADFDSFEGTCNIVSEQNGLDTIVMSDKRAMQICHACRTMKLSNLNVRKAVNLLMSVERMYQERTIDAGKNNDNVLMEYDALKVTKLKSRQEMDFSILWETRPKKGYSNDAHFQWKLDAGDNDYAFKQSIDENGMIEKFVEWTMKDSIQKLRLDGFMELKETARRLISIKQTEHELTKKAKALIGSNSDKYEKIQEVLFKQKMIFLNITELRKHELTALLNNKQKRLTPEAKRYVTNKYKEAYAAFSNNIRLILKDFSLEEKIGLLLLTGSKAVSETDADDIKAANRFAFKVCPEEYLAYIIQNFAEVKYTRDNLLRCTGCKEGDVLTFHNGLGIGKKGQTAVCAKELEGDFEIRFEDIPNTKRKRAYATKAIADLIKIPEPDESMRILTTSEETINTMNLDNKINNVMVASEVILSTKGSKNGEILSRRAGGKATTQLAKFQCSQLQAERNLYDNMKGKISCSMSGFVVRSYNCIPISIIVLSHVQVASQVEMEKAEEIIATKRKKTEAKTQVQEKIVVAKTSTQEKVQNIISKQNIYSSFMSKYCPSALKQKGSEVKQEEVKTEKKVTSKNFSFMKTIGFKGEANI